MKKISAHMILLSIILLSACEKEEKGIQSNAKVFKVDLFKAGLESQLGNAAGYAFVINENGIAVDTTSSGVGGLNLASGSTFPASVLHDINVASVTKALTAMAVIQVMEEQGIDLDDNIGPWLPGYWVKSQQFMNITFRELLTHTSGLRQASTSWDSLKATASRTLAGSNAYSYANANFAIFRALLPKMNDQTTFNSTENNSASFETWMSIKYIEVMQDKVFTPAGLPGINCQVNPAVTTMQGMNELNAPPVIGQTGGNWTELCGGGGFYLSTVEMAKVMAYLAHTFSILSQSQKDLMDDNLLGWDPSDSFSSTYGQVYGKDGGLFWDNDNSGGINGGDSGLQTWVGKFPNGVELALSVTSVRNNWRTLPDIISAAYEDAWVDQ